MAARPAPTPHSEPFWSALREDRIHMQRCLDCGAWIHYPRPRCPRCLGERSEWRDVNPTGTVYTFSVAQQPSHAVSIDEVPLVIAVVELDDGPRVTTNVVGIPADQVRVGQRVTARFEHGDDGLTLLRFTPNE